MAGEIASRSDLPCPSDRLDVPVAGSDREHDWRERRVQVGADPGGDAGAFAGVGVQRLQSGERAGVHLADVVIDGIDVRAAQLGGEGDRQPAGEIQPARPAAVVGARGELDGDGDELLPPAAGNDMVQPLDHGLGAEERCDLRAGVLHAVQGDLGHRAKADRAWRERPAEQFAGLRMRARGRCGRGGGVGGGVGVAHDGLLLSSGLVSGGERLGWVDQSGFVQEAGGAAGGPVTAGRGVGEDQLVFGAGAGDVEQAALLGQLLTAG